MHHSDAEGLHVPIDFPAPLTAAAGEYVLGGTVGSSVQLRRELLQFAPSLDIALSDGKLDEALRAPVPHLRSGHREHQAPQRDSAG